MALGVSIARAAGNSAAWANSLNPAVRMRGELSYLFGTPTTLADFQGVVSRLNAVIADPSSVSDLTLAYLETEGGLAEWDEDFTYHHRDYWITRLAYENLTLTGRTFGDANPTSLAAADPLDLRLDVNGVLRTDVLMLDYDAVSTDAADQYGPVIVKTPNTCTLPDGTTAKTFGGSALFFTSTGAAYRYQFLGGEGSAADGLNCWSSLNEFGGGGGRVRFLDSGTGIENKTVTLYVRYSANHVIRSSLYFGKRSGTTDARRIIIRGYPTDAIPIVRCGTATPGDNTVTSFPTFRMGQDNAPQARTNMWFRWLDFVGNRDHAGYDGGAAGLCYAQTLFYVGSYSSNLSIRYCKLRDFQAITSDHAQAATYPQFVDVASAGRSGAYDMFGVDCKGDGLDFQYNYVRAAEDDIPYDYANPAGSGVYSRGVNCEGSDGTVAYSTFEGFCSGDYIHFTPTQSAATQTGMWIHNNVVTCNGYTAVLAVCGVVVPDEDELNIESLSGTIENNFIYNWGTTGIGGAGAVLFGKGITFRYNVVAGNIDGHVYRTGLATSGFRIDTMDKNGAAVALPNVDAYGNILWKAGATIGNNNGFNFPAAGTSFSRLFNNIIYDLSQPNKETPDGEVADEKRDGVILLQTSSTVGLGNNAIYDNCLVRPAGEVNSATLMLHRTASAYNHYGTGGLAGHFGNTSRVPYFADADNGDFRILNDGPWREWFPADMPYTRALTGAWTPPT